MKNGKIEVVLEGPFRIGRYGDREFIIDGTGVVLPMSAPREEGKEVLGDIIELLNLGIKARAEQRKRKP
jgi:hypothetical protein